MSLASVGLKDFNPNSSGRRSSGASHAIAGPQKEPFRGDKQLFIDDLEQALYASKIISYTQGFMLMRETAKEVCS